MFDKEVKRCKQRFWFEQQKHLNSVCNDSKKHFWKEIGKWGIAKDRKSHILTEAVDSEGNLYTKENDVLLIWEKYFRSLLNDNVSGNTDNVPCNTSYAKCQTNVNLEEVNTVITHWLIPEATIF